MSIAGPCARTAGIGAHEYSRELPLVLAQSPWSGRGRARCGDLGGASRVFWCGRLTRWLPARLDMVVTGEPARASPLPPVAILLVLAEIRSVRCFAQLASTVSARDDVRALARSKSALSWLKVRLY